MAMKVVKIFFFILTYCFVTASEISKNNSNLVFDEFKDFEEKCPRFWSSIQKSDIVKFATNCNYTLAASFKNHELMVHKSMCFLANAMLSKICKESKDNETIVRSFLNATEEKSSCPIDIHVTEDFNYPVLLDILKLLRNETLCYQICHDFNDFEKQCSVLIKLNNFIKIMQNSRSNFVKDINEMPKMEPIINSEKPFVQVQETAKPKTVISQEYTKLNNKSKPVSVKESNVTRSELELSNSDLLTKEELNEPYKKKTLKQDEKMTPQFMSNLEDESDSLKIKPESNDNLDINEETEANAFIESNLNVESSENAISMVKQNRVSEVPNQNQVYSGGYFQPEDSHFFFYFIMFSSLIILGYFAFHNKNKILAYALEGRSEKRSRRRPNPAKYSKLESNLEEAIGSNIPQATSSTTVVY